MIAHVLYLVVRNVSKHVGHGIRRDEDSLLSLRPRILSFGRLVRGRARVALRILPLNGVLT